MNVVNDIKEAMTDPVKSQNVRTCRPLQRWMNGPLSKRLFFRHPNCKKFGLFSWIIFGWRVITMYLSIFETIPPYAISFKNVHVMCSPSFDKQWAKYPFLWRKTKFWECLQNMCVWNWKNAHMAFWAIFKASNHSLMTIVQFGLDLLHLSSLLSRRFSMPEGGTSQFGSV